MMEVCGGLNLKSIEQKSLNVKYVPGGCVIPSRGAITFELPQVVDKCIIEFQKKQGFDNYLIINGVQHHLVPSLKAEVTLNNVKSISIQRKEKAAGNIIVSSISYLSSNQFDNVNDWNNIGKKLGATVGIKILDNGIHAGEYAKILDASNIQSIETFPANAFVRKKDVIKFLAPCKILSVTLNGENKVRQNKLNLGVNMLDMVTSYASVNNENVIFESSLQFFKMIKSPFINLVGSGSIILDRQAEIIIKSSNILPNKKYIFNLSMNNIKGNGSCSIAVYNDSGLISKKTFRANNSTSNINIDVVTPSGYSYFKIIRGKNISTGQIILNSFKIINPEGQILNDDIRKTLTQSLQVLRPTKTVDNVINNIELCDDCFELWFNKVNTIKQYGNNYNISFCTINDEPKNDRVFINEFSSVDLSSNQINNFAHCYEIYTPSLLNFFTLQEALPNNEIKVIGRYWPIIDDFNGEDCQNKILYFHKDEQITKKLIDNWDSSIGELLIVDYDICCDGITSISGNLSIREILTLMSESYCVLDLSCINNHYISGVIEFALAYNSNIITNNKKYILESVDFVSLENSFLFDWGRIKNLLISSKSNKKKFGLIDCKAYNKKFLDATNAILGVK